MDPFRKKSTIIPLLFCILIGSLVVHLLIEDTLFMKMFASFDSTPADSFTENSDACEHLDDLIQAAGQPVNVTGEGGSIAFSWTAPFREQALLLVFTPPKI
jgi:hypothetical protein